MSINLGFGKSKSKSRFDNTTTENFDKTTEAINPDWVAKGTEALGAKIGAAAAKSPLDYFADVNPLQEQAGQGAAALGIDDTWFKDFMAMPKPTVSAESALRNIASYFSPYQKEVVDATAADMDADAAATRAQQDLAIARESGFGGSGAAITKSETEGQLSRARAATLAGIRDQGFQRAAALSSEDAARRQAANTTNAQLDLESRGLKAQTAGQKADSDRADVAAQAQIGDALRAVAGEKARAPLDLLEWQIGAWDSLPLDLLRGERSFGSANNHSFGSSKGSSSNIGVSAGFTYGGGK